MRTEITPEGVTWRLDASIQEWVAGLPIHAASAIGAALDERLAENGGNSLFLPANVVAQWTESASRALGLPPNCPLALDLRLSGAMGKSDASISVRWLQPGKTVAARGVTRAGLWLHCDEKTYRVASPVFEALELAEIFNQARESTIEEQFRLWARIREQLGETQAPSITDAFLCSLRVVTASALTFSITTDERGDVQLDPVLLTTKSAPDGDRVEHVRALTEVDESVFPVRLDQLREGVCAFPLSQGTYVVADEALQRALGVVRQLRKAPPEQRKRAAMYPGAVIRELLGLEDDTPTVFVETERFAERVLDVGEWAAPILPWIKIASQNWGAPASSGVRINGVDLPLDAAVLEAAVQDMRAAAASGASTITVADAEIHVTPANVRALEDLQKAVSGCRGLTDEEAPEIQAIKNVLIIETNFEEATFNRVTLGKRRGNSALPNGLKTAPKPHQTTGIHWLQSHWVEGSRGALLCDDMGLGKTFQALAFCRWLQDLMASGAIERKPILIIAPVGLLRNWEREISEHLREPGLGQLVRAYGDNLKVLRRGRHIDGTAGLDTARLAVGDVVLANYEAVSDYQLSFGAVPFSMVVLDEAQKIKSPKARMTHAVKALNAEFMLAMTGTPVENRLADLWCIADAVQPGALADLRDFSARYEVPDGDVKGLRDMVWHDESADASANPRMLLRRLKTENLEGLPQKHEHVMRVPMPPCQAEAYERALAMKALAGPEGTLGMIHALRRVSLHPMLLEAGAEGMEELRIEDSARLVAAINVLDKVAASGEKALVFLESLDLQEADQLPMLLKRRYGMARLPMVINGEVNAEARQARVERFQAEPGFDVMLLSPKAGGVGLTLTAANHVVHLSRWWNPAVEDQCSDRVYRIGQTKPVHIYYPLAVLPHAEEFSFDVQLQVLMDRKRKLAQNLLAAPVFTQADYEFLLNRSKHVLQVH